jgi:hypothetical protein
VLFGWQLERSEREVEGQGSWLERRSKELSECYMTTQPPL